MQNSKRQHNSECKTVTKGKRGMTGLSVGKLKGK